MQKLLIRMSGEMLIKSNQVRNQFVKSLVKNIKDALKSNNISFKLEKQWSRIYLEHDHKDTHSILQRIFGIQSFSPVVGQCQSELEEIKATGVELFKQKIEGKSFAVRARRSGKHHFSSMDVQKSLGAALNSDSKSRVDLSHPDIGIFVEIRDSETYFYSDHYKGSGGLPIGTGGHGICLMSGGFDSPVAAWKILKRGVTLDFLFCNLAGEAYERSVLNISKTLSDKWCYGFKPSIYILDFEAVSKNLKESVHPKYNQVILKRLFYKAADKVSKVNGANAIVTGEAIGQVSSQTLVNLRAIEADTELPVLRPVISYDKEEIIQLSKVIGTHDQSASIQEFCQLTDAKPSTHCSIERARTEEANCDLTVLEKAVSEAKNLSLRQLNSAELTTPYIFKNAIKQNDIVIDCRNVEEYKLWHYKNASHKDYYELLEGFEALPKERTYILYCAVGMQSAIIAEKMQNKGYLAYSFKGGVHQLKKLASDQVKA